MKKLILGLSMATCAFAQTPDLSAALANFEQELGAFASTVAGEQQLSLYVRTEDDKFIRVYSKYRNARGTELNSIIAKTLANTGRYDGVDTVFPELGVQCKKVSMLLAKDSKLAIAYDEDCKKNA